MRLDNFKVPGKDLKVNGVLRIKGAKLNGSTSSTTNVHQGYEPKKILVTVQIAHDKEGELNSIFTAAETLGDDDSPKVYTIADKTANAMGVKQVKFIGDVRVRVKGKLKAWLVSFTLLEHLSVAEKIEKRQSPNEPIEASSEGETISDDSNTEEEPNLTGFEQVLKTLDESLA